MADKLYPIDAAARVAHRHLLIILGFVLLLGLAALLQFASTDLARLGNALWLVMPIVIIIIAGALSSMQKRVDKASMKAVRNDEFRQAGLQGALRNGFLVMLALQPILAVGLSLSSFEHEAAVMAAATIIAASVTVLASLIWHDH